MWIVGLPPQASSGEQARTVTRIWRRPGVDTTASKSNTAASANPFNQRKSRSGARRFYTPCRGNFTHHAHVLGLAARRRNSKTPQAIAMSPKVPVPRSGIETVRLSRD
jgi:hypothetical protein